MTARDESEAYDWQTDALCRQVDADAFFPEKGGSSVAMKRICNVCPVKQDCLEYALDNDERYGIWGGTSERERARMKREQRQAQAS